MCVSINTDACDDYLGLRFNIELREKNLSIVAFWNPSRMEVNGKQSDAVMGKMKSFTFK